MKFGFDMCCISCSALYVVDLKKFRQTAAGDNLRVIYETLSKDPNSLANLDQVCNSVFIILMNHVFPRLIDLLMEKHTIFGHLYMFFVFFILFFPVCNIISLFQIYVNCFLYFRIFQTMPSIQYRFFHFPRNGYGVSHGVVMLQNLTQKPLIFATIL